MLLSDHVPCFLHLDQFDCQVWYAGQPHQCLICLSSDHRAPACPFSSLYRRCRKPGHIARECTQAWCPSVSAPATDTSYEPSASSDRVMTDASPAVPYSDPIFFCFWFCSTCFCYLYCPCLCADCSCFCCCSRSCLRRSCLC